jgi:site-specific DNA-methyltransferase (adenine-specific)
MKRPRLFSQGASYQLYKGDCVEVLSHMPAESFDMGFADSPYFLSNGGSSVSNGKWASNFKGEWDRSRGLEADHAFVVAWLTALQRVLKPSGTLWATGTMHVIFDIGYAMRKLGWHILNVPTWYKPNAPINASKRMLTHSTELVIWAAPRRVDPMPHVYNYKALKELLGEEPRDMWRIPVTPQGQRAHGRYPAQKPLELLRRCILASTKEGARVLDPFNGSGTTGVAALSMGREYVGIDKSKRALELTQKRLDDVLEERPVKAS